MLVNDADEETSKLFFSLGANLPVAGTETIHENGFEQPMRRGSYIYDRSTDSYYVAKEDVADASSLDIEGSESFAKVGTYVREQGAEWSANTTYYKGQIVLHEGVYYENQTNNPDPFTKEARGFNNRIEDYSSGAQADFNPEVFSPSDKFFFETDDALSQEFLDMQRAKGEPILIMSGYLLPNLSSMYCHLMLKVKLMHKLRLNQQVLMVWMQRFLYLPMQMVKLLACVLMTLENIFSQ